MPFQLRDRLNYLFSLKSKYFYKEIKYFTIGLLNDQKKFDEEIAKHSRIIVQRVGKNNRKMFEKIYSAFLDEISEDQYNEDGIIVKFHVAKF